MPFAPLSWMVGDNTRLSHLPGDLGWPVLGFTVHLLQDPLKIGQRNGARYGHIFYSRAFFRIVVMMLGPEANQLVLLDKDRNFSSTGGWEPMLGKLFPNGLMLRDFDDHLFHRRIMQAAFKREALERYVEALNQGIGQTLPEWGQRRWFPFYPAIKSLTLSLAAQVFLGMPLGAESDRVNQAFCDLVGASLALVRLNLPFGAYGKGLRGRAFLASHFASLIPDRRASQATDMFSQLCRATDEEGKQFSDQEIIDHMIFLMMAAHDTLTSSLSTMMAFLAMHPEWQERLRRECQALRSRLIGSPSTGRQEVPPAAFDQLGALEEVEWAFKEALRLNPPLMSIARRAVRDVVFEGHRIPANTAVSIDPGYTHRMPEWWTNPEQFDPERFSPARAEDKRHRFDWIPFGGGAHVCIGLQFATLQMKVFMYHLLNRYRVEVRPGYEPVFQRMPISKPKDGLPIHLQPLT